MKKKILMLAPFFFDYEKRIKEELENRDYSITLYNDYSTIKEQFTFIDKIKMKVLRKKKIIKNLRKEEYFKNILRKEAKNKYDIIFIIKGSSIPKFFFEEIKKLNIEAEWISYQWDDMENCKEFLEFKGYFNKIYSYSLEDSKKYNFIYRPFFYSDEKNIEKKEVDISFVGSLHSDRKEIIKKIYFDLMKKNISFFCKIYLAKNKYFRKLLWLGKKRKMYTTNPIPYNEFLEIFAKSKAILEIQHPRQKTITTRSIEALGTKTKVITTVENIKNYDFYDEANYLVITRDNLSISKKWLEEEYKEIDENIKEKYSLKKWGDEIFGEEK